MFSPAVIPGHLAVVQALIESGANFNHSNTQGLVRALLLKRVQTLASLLTMSTLPFPLQRPIIAAQLEAKLAELAATEPDVPTGSGSGSA